MLLSKLRRVLSWLSKVSKDRKVMVLLGILAFGAYLRLWNIHHLFNVVHDYDEGAHALGARLIAQGYLPYQDFLLVHPPLHELVLGGIYKVFGYSFFSGRYLSIALSLACIIIIYLVGKKMYHTTAGLIAAALFAVSTDMVYFGRRVVLETMGIFLILLAIYFAIDFVQNKKLNRLFFCGLALGLAIATKYLFVPAVVAIIVAIALLTMRERFWRSLNTLGKPSLWVMYLCFAAIFSSLLMLLKWSLKLNVSISFLDPMYWTFEDAAVTILVFLIPLVISWVILERYFLFKEWWLGVWGLRRSQALWLLLVGTVIGFILVTGFFWVKMPQEFISQTVLLQQNRPPGEFPALVGMIRVAILTPNFLSMASLPTLFVVPAIFILLNKKGFSENECFLSVTLIVSLLLCQWFYHLPRYHVSVLPFLLLGIAQFVPPLDIKKLTNGFNVFTTRFKASLLVVLTIFIFFLTLSLILLTNYTGYDVFGGGRFASNEENLYRESLDYLEGAGARKIYAANPIFPALSPNLNSTLAFDTFALLWMEKRSPEEIVNDAMEAGVDYIVLDPWVWWWGYPLKTQTEELVQEVRRNAKLVKVVEPNSICATEIYLLGVDKEGIFNGQFDHWAKLEEIQLPIGWEPVLASGKGDKATIAETFIDGVKCAKLTIYEDGTREENRDSTHAGIRQKILFPESTLKVEVFPTVNTRTTGRVVLGSGIHFIDEHGHALIIGFSNEVDEEEVTLYGGGNRMLVVKGAQLNQWSEHSIDLSDYWKRANWWQPEEIQIYFVISTYYSEPGYYVLYVAKVEADSTK
ncbi:ArnT family glycosyltransferase [Chloroflexota bacterium]